MPALINQVEEDSATILQLSLSIGWISAAAVTLISYHIL